MLGPLPKMPVPAMQIETQLIDHIFGHVLSAHKCRFQKVPASNFELLTQPQDTKQRAVHCMSQHKRVMMGQTQPTKLRAMLRNLMQAWHPTALILHALGCPASLTKGWQGGRMEAPTVARLIAGQLKQPFEKG